MASHCVQVLTTESPSDRVFFADAQTFEIIGGVQVGGSQSSSADEALALIDPDGPTGSTPSRRSLVAVLVAYGEAGSEDDSGHEDTAPKSKPETVQLPRARVSQAEWHRDGCLALAAVAGGAGSPVDRNPLCVC